MDRVGDLARGALRKMLPPAKRRELEVCMAWPGAVGPDVASRTRPLSLVNKTLIVGADNAAWAMQMGYLVEELKEKLNDVLGEELVTHIRFVAKPPGRAERLDGE